MIRGHRQPRIAASRIACAIAALMLGSIAQPARSADDVMRVHFIDVGQGAATLVEFPCGTVLIDTGGERFPKDEDEPAVYHSTRPLMRYLRGFFAKDATLDLLILTHPHKDHTRGVPAVLETFSPKNVVHNGQWHGSGIEEQTRARDYVRDTPGVHSWYVLEPTIDDNGLSNDVIDPLNGDKCQPTDPKIRVLWGQVKDDSGWGDKDFEDGNNHSVVVRIDFGEASILFPGDLEETTEDDGSSEAGIERIIEKYKSTNLLDVDVYHVSHHGSHNGTTKDFLTAMSPEIAVIPSGPRCKRGGYSAYQHGHPRLDTFNDLQAAVSGTRSPKQVTVFRGQHDPRTRTVTKAIYATGWDGNIVLEARADGTWKVDSTSGQPSCPQ